MKLYETTSISPKERYMHNGEKLFLRQVRDSFEGFKVTVDEIHTDVPMIIQKHTNPLNKNLHDMKAKYLDSTGDFMHIGNIVTLDTNKVYMAVTEPSSNGIYSEYKVLPLTDDMKFNLGTPIEMRCVVANKGFYDETSFVNDTNVFEDMDTRATIVQYNPNTAKLSLFDDVYINDEQYRIVKIDNHTFKEYDEEFGVLQLVIVDTPFGEILRNETTTLKGVIMSERVKDKILNSVSRRLLCEHNFVKRGDYINFTYDRDSKGTLVTDTYLTVNNPTMGRGYDTSLLYLCESTVNLLDDKGAVVNVPVYFEDNRMRIDKTTESEFITLKNSSFLIVVQNNEVTRKLRNSVKRIIIGDTAYKITGDDPTSIGLLSVGLEIDQISPSDDNLELGIANYHSQMEEINVGVKPEIPSSDIKIVESNVEVALYKGYENEYYLNLVDSGVVWSVDKSWVDIRQDGTKCWIKFNELKYIGEIITLTALVGDDEYTLTIKCVDM